MQNIENWVISFHPVPVLFLWKVAVRLWKKSTMPTHSPSAASTWEQGLMFELSMLDFGVDRAQFIGSVLQSLPLRVCV